jgi:EAL and modified HD-GYP domain-containing signal transduction protein
MDVFVARQPIFDRRTAVAGYELLFRAGLENAFPAGMDGDVASSRVISDALTVFGFDALTGGKVAYINATRRVLIDRLYAALPTARTVIEVLETVERDDDAVAACRAAKDAGYTVALDDFVGQPKRDALLPLADIVKVDFMATDPAVRSELPRRLGPKRIQWLAEKVETRAEFDQAVKDGYTLFQGYFFCRPEIIARKDLSTSKLVYLQFLRELGRDELDYDRLEQVIKQDMGLSVKLLRYLNSAWFGWRCRVTSLKQAIVMLGERPFRQWASLVAVVGIAADRPAELASMCLARARFCELLGPQVGMVGQDLDLFLAGLLSSMDALVGRPLAEIVAELGVNKDVADALIGERKTPLGRLVKLVCGYERGEWARVGRLRRLLHLEESKVAAAYTEALKWVSAIYPGR